MSLSPVPEEVKLSLGGVKGFGPSLGC